MKLQRAWRVHNRTMWQTYCAQVSVVANQMTQCPTHRATPINFRAAFEATTTELPGTLNADTNEHYLLSGVPKETAQKIMTTGMNERFSGANAGTMFGSGCYFAEDGAKVDQYTRTPDTTGAVLPEPLLYPKNDHPARTGEAQQGVQYVFLCRVVLGCTVRTKDGQTSLDRRATTTGLWATGERRELGEIAGASASIPYHSLLAELGGSIHRYREIIVFNGARVYPEYLVAYSREGS